MQVGFKSNVKRFFTRIAHFPYRVLAVLLGVTIVWFAINSIYRSIEDVAALHLYELSTISANEIHLSIDSFDPDTDRVQVTARPAYSDAFIVYDMQKVIPEFVDPELAAKAPRDVRFGKLLVSDLSPMFNAGGLRLAQLGMAPKPDDCKSKQSAPNEAAETDTWKVLELPLDRNFYSLWKGPEMYPFDEYLVLGRADRVVQLCYKGQAYSQDSTLDVSVTLPGFTVWSATPTELIQWPTLVGSEEYQKSVPKNILPEVQKQASLSKSGYSDRMWHDQQIALIIRRPLAIQRMAILLLGITSIATILLAGTCPPKQIGQNFVGSLLTIWAVRGLLNLNAPKTPDLLDYFAMTLFAIIAAIYLWRYLWNKPRSQAKTARES